MESGGWRRKPVSTLRCFYRLPSMVQRQRSGQRPEAFQGVAVGAFAQLLERPVADLADALARNPQHAADLLERALLALVQAVVQVQDLALALGEVLFEHLLQELAPGLGLD